MHLSLATKSAPTLDAWSMRQLQIVKCQPATFLDGHHFLHRRLLSIVVVYSGFYIVRGQRYEQPNQDNQGEQI